MAFTLCISGSSRLESSNRLLLKAIDQKYKANFHFFDVHKLPLFGAEEDIHPWDDNIIEWRRTVRESSSVLIVTPVYIFNIPAALKNALEWLTTSGELDQKRVLPITYTPHPPRGEKAMQSLLWSLQALNAQIVAQVPLYQSELSVDDELNLIGDNSIEILDAAIELIDLGII